MEQNVNCNKISNHVIRIEEEKREQSRRNIWNNKGQ